MKKKIVLKVQMNCQKCRRKAMLVAGAADGTISVAIEGKDKELVVIVGEGVDAADLTNSMRKKVGHTELVSVGEVKEAWKEEKKETGLPQWTPNYHPVPQYIFYERIYDKYPDQCSIM